MKKLFLAIAAVAMFFATSCQKENVNEPALSAEDNEFICVIDQNATSQNAPAVNDNKGTLAHIDGSNNVWWQEGDQIAYYGSENTQGVGRYELTCSKLSDNSAYFSAEGKHFYQGAHEAYYPASIMTLNNQGQKVLSLPSTITLEAGKNAGCLPMYGTGNGTHYLTFHNLCAVLKITMPPYSILSYSKTHIEISSDKAMNGAFVINDNNVAVMSATNPTAAQKKITVSKSSGDCFAENEVVYVAIPAQHYDSLTIEFIYHDNSPYSVFTGYYSVWTKAISNVNVEASKVYPITVTAMDHEYVDLGLSVKWATCNIGAGTPGGYGDYFAWGETSARTVSTSVWFEYKYVTYDLPNYTNITMTKYTETGDKTVLEPSDDAAHVIWGGNWRMPTKAEWQELLDNCTWNYDIAYGVWGYRITSNKPGYTSKFIFLPAAGFYYIYQHLSYGIECRYWSSTLHIADAPDATSGGTRCWWAYNAYVNTAGQYSVAYQDRYILNPIRPVCP